MHYSNNFFGDKKFVWTFYVLNNVKVGFNTFLEIFGTSPTKIVKLQCVFRF